MVEVKKVILLHFGWDSFHGNAQAFDLDAFVNIAKNLTVKTFFRAFMFCFYCLSVGRVIPCFIFLPVYIFNESKYDYFHRKSN